MHFLVLMRSDNNGPTLGSKKCFDYAHCILSLGMMYLSSVDINNILQCKLPCVLTNNIPCLQCKLPDMFTNNIPCLQCKLPCIFTNNNKDQAGW